MAEDLELKRAFFTESEEILERLAVDLAGLQAKPKDMDLVNGLFRGLHTIKGNSSFLNMENVTRISHAAETLLDKARRHELPVSKEMLLIMQRVLSDLGVMIRDQETNLDITVPVAVIQRFLAGDSKSVKQLAEAQVHSQSQEPKKVQLHSFVRVDEGKIGKILGLTSELELLRYALEAMPERMEALGAVGADLRFDMDLQVGKLSRLVRSLSGIVFGVRLVPVNQVFQRFPRVVKELAVKLGKNIDLKIVNGDAELDKSIVEAIGDPMTHLIRNSADHGIESVGERKRMGKNPMGVIRLNSFVRGNFVYIEISDDGRGIDGDKILKKAVEKGIVPSDKAHAFTDSQKLALIFAPGFSTAEKVTDISGRGVGMDVVKSNINKLKGTVLIESEPGRGTIIQLRFPMSVVVLFSLFLEVNKTTCAIPVDQIDESIDVLPGELLGKIPEGEDPTKFLGLISLKSLLWDTPPEADDRAIYHSLRFKDPRGKQLAFVVDDFSSIEEAIVQSVDSYIAALPGLQGASIRKDGSVALVLDVQNIMHMAENAKPFAYVRIKERVLEKDSLSNFLEFAN